MNITPGHKNSQQPCLGNMLQIATNGARVCRVRVCECHWELRSARCRASWKFFVLMKRG